MTHFAPELTCCPHLLESPFLLDNAAPFFSDSQLVAEMNLVGGSTVRIAEAAMLAWDEPWVAAFRYLSKYGCVATGGLGDAARILRMVASSNSRDGTTRVTGTEPSPLMLIIGIWLFCGRY